MVGADRRLKVYGREEGAVRIFLNSPCAGCTCKNGEVRQVDWVVFLRGGGDDPEGLRVNHLGASIRTLADLAHADASIDTSCAHSTKGADRILGAILGQRGGGGIQMR